LTCQICETRRPRRHCPGVRGEICAPCCGTHREVTVDCPLDCVYLRDARRHEKQPPLDSSPLPHPDIEVTETFIEERQGLFALAAVALYEAATQTSGAIDSDVGEALEALIQTRRTVQSGLIYETKPSNLVAAAIQQRFGQAEGEFRAALRERTGMESIREADMLGVLVFLQRLAISNHNGRKRCRAFIDFLRSHFSPQPGRMESLLDSGPALIVP